MGSIARMVAALSVLCALSGFVLSYLKISTAPLIAEQVLTYVQGPALERVFPDAENIPLRERQSFTLPDGREVVAFPAKKGGTLYGVALENGAQGYGGDLNVMVGFDISRDALIGIGITTMRETPGLGTGVAESSFTNQFKGLDLPAELSTKGGSVDAVSGATVSSTAVIGAIQKAAADYQTLRDQILAKWQ